MPISKRNVLVCHVEQFFLARSAFSFEVERKRRIKKAVAGKITSCEQYY
jgi:hypothetical protein